VLLAESNQSDAYEEAELVVCIDQDSTAKRTDSADE
jgi:hypothetical protein